MQTCLEEMGNVGNAHVFLSKKHKQIGNAYVFFSNQPKKQKTRMCIHKNESTVWKRVCVYSQTLKNLAGNAHV